MTEVTTPAASLDECVRLLRSDTDEQRLVGLLLATKLVEGGDAAAVGRVFDAVGFSFIDRLCQSAGLGSGQGAAAAAGGGPPAVQQQAYTGLALSILGAFCRSPELAAAPEMVAKVPLLVSVVRSRRSGELMQDAYECLLGVAAASAAGLAAVKEEEGLKEAAAGVAESAPDAPWLPLAVKFLLFLFSKGVSETDYYEYKKQLAQLVPAVAREFAARDDALKFACGDLLAAVLAPEAAECVRAEVAKQKQQGGGAEWLAHVRTGVGKVLHSRVDVSKRQQALRLARVAVEIDGEAWLAGRMGHPPNGAALPPDRFFLLLVESLRVEIPVLLDTMARITFDEAEKRASKAKEADAAAEAKEEEKKAAGGEAGNGRSEFQVDTGKSANWGALLAQMGDFSDLANGGELDAEPAPEEEAGTSPELLAAQAPAVECYALMEHVVEAMSAAAAGADDDCDTEGPGDGGGTGGGGGGGGRGSKGWPRDDACRLSALSDGTVKRALSAVDDAISAVLEFLEEAQKHGLSEDAGVLASIRLVGKYLAEAPGAHRRRVARLLAFMLSCKSEEEDIPVQVVKFLLPYLLQLTTEPSGCRSLVKRGGHKSIVGFVQESSRTNMMGVLRGGKDAHHALVEACDVLFNIFGTREDMKVPMDAIDFAPLLAAMCSWTSATGIAAEEKPLVLAMGACMVASVLEVTSEEDLKKRLDLASYKRLPRAMKVVVAFLEQWHEASEAGKPWDEERDLYDITVTICAEVMPQWPYLKRSFVTSQWWQKLFDERPVTPGALQTATPNPVLRSVLAAAAAQ